MLCLLTAAYRTHDIESQGLYSNPIHFYDFIQNRVMIIFRPKFDDPDHDHPEFSLVLSKKQNYDTVCDFLYRFHLSLNFLLDVDQSWGVSTTRSNQATIHDNPFQQWQCQSSVEAVSQPKHRRDHDALLFNKYCDSI